MGGGREEGLGGGVVEGGKGGGAGRGAVDEGIGNGNGGRRAGKRRETGGAVSVEIGIVERESERSECWSYVSSYFYLLTASHLHLSLSLLHISFIILSFCLESLREHCASKRGIINKKIK